MIGTNLGGPCPTSSTLSAELTTMHSAALVDINAAINALFPLTPPFPLTLPFPLTPPSPLTLPFPLTPQYSFSATHQASFPTENMMLPVSSWPTSSPSFVRRDPDLLHILTMAILCEQIEFHSIGLDCFLVTDLYMVILDSQEGFWLDWNISWAFN